MKVHEISRQTCEWENRRKVHNEESHSLQASPDDVKVIRIDEDGLKAA
jgi:hypothetical protein